MKGCALLLLVVSTSASAVVIRADINDANYRIPATAVPALVDLPGEGHGVLIAPTWVVTAAHAVSWQASISEVYLNGKARKVVAVIKYPGYQTLPEALGKQALASGDASKIHAFLAESNDIALIELATPASDVTPMPLYRGDDLQEKTVEIVGKGATGNGADGESADAPHRTELRHAYNVVSGANAHWLWYTFRAPPAALPLEGTIGNGDSGGPLILDSHGKRELAGLASWKKYPDGRLRDGGHYGLIVYNVRVGAYAPWIDEIMSARATSPNVTPASHSGH
ncbi:S1 family peptidase [Luteibacter aegosomatissinici]|uniref:S1 family peptidase n=1 Tax=Luteibacter aegosomatissinici TaxID=2911539 RepID=UPI001FF8986E|nr:trypsin-like serine protease [Luteibacter aegosomatissinici]UPG96605.1 trypsin-like serine protease [Luteibacter aegosomatissinici]